jgi:sugar/nucleoside kinase (ribokinase family)
VVPKFDITIVGEINLDLILYGLPAAMPTERELLADGMALTLGSSSAILAHNLSVLGTRVGFATKVGSDPLGRIALERLAESGVDLSRVVQAQDGISTGLTLILPHGRDRHILTYPGAMFDLHFEDLDLNYLASARHFHMSSLFLHRGLLKHVPELFRRLKSAGLTTSLDTNDDPDDRWDGVLPGVLPHIDILLPNEREAMKIARKDNLESALTWLSERVPTVVVKLGPRGAMAVSNGVRVMAEPVPVKVVDPVGAGDSFDAGFLHKHLQGAEVGECLRFGNMMGAFSTLRPGGTEAFRDRKLLSDFVSSHAGVSRTAQISRGSV